MKYTESLYHETYVLPFILWFFKFTNKEIFSRYQEYGKLEEQPICIRDSP